MIFLGFAIADSLGAHCASDLVSGGRVFAIFVERRCDDRRGMSVKFHCKAVSPPQQLRVSPGYVSPCAPQLPSMAVGSREVFAGVLEGE